MRQHIPFQSHYTAWFLVFPMGCIFRSSIWAPDGQIVKTETVQTDTTPFQ